MKMVGDTKLVLLVPSCVDGWTATDGLVALLVGADLFRDDCCVIVLAIRAVGAGVFMNAAHVSHGDIVLDCEQAP